MPIAPIAAGPAPSFGMAVGARPQPDAAASVRGAEATECQTCRNRRYQDRSDDPTVSFQTPTQVPREGAYEAVRSHENEHVRNEQGRAEATGRKVVSQSVTVYTAVCPECGRVYVSGGETVTITKPDAEADRPDERRREGSGRFVDVRV